MTLQLLLHYGTWYLIIGFISAWIINQFIKLANQEPYTGPEIFFAILLWPLNVAVFIGGIIYSFFE
jgi:hypothetical protein